MTRNLRKAMLYSKQSRLASLGVLGCPNIDSSCAAAPHQPQLDPANEQLVGQHAVCAASEAPLQQTADQHYFGHGLLKAAADLMAIGEPGPSPRN